MIRIPVLVFLCAFAYYYFLSAKEWTWLFVSSDSGSWIAAAATWMIPQPLGSPLYISLGRLISLLPGDLSGNVTIWLSALPAAVTVMLVYLIAHRMTNRASLASLAAGILLASGVFLSQSTVVEEYAISAMFITLAFWYFICGHRWRMMLALSAGIVVHSIVIIITVLWLLLMLRDYRRWIAPTVMLIGISLLWYSLIPVLMYLDTPKFWTGWLSWDSLSGYTLGSNAETIGSLGIWDAPERLLMTGSIILMSFGLALIPIWIGIRATIQSVSTRVILMIVSLGLWFHVVSIDSTTWTFIAFGAPLVAVLAALGLDRLPRIHYAVVAVSVLGLLVTNTFLLNAGTLTRQNPWASDYHADIMELPPNSYVAVQMGGPYGLGMMKAVVTERPDLTPLFVGGVGSDGNLPPRWAGYLDWLRNEKGVEIAQSRDEPGTPHYMDLIRWADQQDEELFWCYVAETPEWFGAWPDNVPYNGSFERVVIP